MIPSRTSVLAAAALCLGITCTGCALPPQDTADGKVEKQYRTGSNIPVKEGTPSELRNVDSNSLQDPRNRSIGSPLQKGG